MNQNNGKNQIIYLFIIAAILLFAGLGSSPIYILDEARNAQCAREMMENNDWLLPTFNAELRAHKPPMHYYFIRFGYSIFGTNEFGARFFSAVTGFLTLLITFYFTKKYVSKLVALIAVAFLLSSVHFLFEFRLAVPDPYLIFFTVLVFFAFFEYVQSRKFLYLLIAAIATGLAILTKGPVALALPALSIFIWLLWERKLKILLSWKMIVAFVIVCLVAVPWYWLIHKATNGVFTQEFFFTHNLNRFSDTMEGHGGIFLLVPLFVIVGMLPGSVFMGEAFKKIRKEKNVSLIKLAAVVVTVFVVFYSTSNTKLPNYPMPCYPFAAILLAYGAEQFFNASKRMKQYPFFILLFINLILPVGAYFAIRIEPALKGMEWIAAGLIILPVTATIAFYKNRKSGFRPAMNFLFAGYMIFNLIFLVVLYPAAYKKNPVTTSLHLINPDKQVYAYEIYNPAFNFYLNKPVKEFKDTAQLYSALSKDTAGIIITRLNLLGALDSTKYKIVTSKRDLFETPTTVLLKLK